MLKYSMPYEDDVWYHVTTWDRLPGIAAHGLIPQGGGETNWDVKMVEGAVYLWSSIASAEGHMGLFLRKHTRDESVLLRVRGLGGERICADHETVARWIEDAFDISDLSGYASEDFEIGPSDVTLSELKNAIGSSLWKKLEAAKGRYGYSIEAEEIAHLIPYIPSNICGRLARASSVEGDAVLAITTVPPSKIDVMILKDVEDPLEPYEGDPEDEEAMEEWESNLFEKGYVNVEQFRNDLSVEEDNNLYASSYEYIPITEYV